MDQKGYVVENRKEEIEQELAKLYALKHELNEIEDAEQKEINKTLIGKCYKYRNNYSCPESDSDYWYIYARMIRIDEDGLLVAVRFQIDRNGRIEIEEDTDFTSQHYASSWIEIQSEEYLEAMSKASAGIERFFQSATSPNVAETK